MDFAVIILSQNYWSQTTHLIYMFVRLNKVDAEFT